MSVLNLRNVRCIICDRWLGKEAIKSGTIALKCPIDKHWTIITARETSKKDYGTIDNYKFPRIKRG